MTSDVLGEILTDADSADVDKIPSIARYQIELPSLFRIFSPFQRREVRYGP